VTEQTSIARFREWLEDGSLDVSREILPGDQLYNVAYRLGGAEFYFRAGHRAVRCIRLALLAARRDTVESILDFASGAGRVMRYLKAAFPDASLTACDVLAQQVEFCERAFGAAGVVSKDDPAELELDAPFDLIWCGSLLTHVDADRWPGFLKLFESALSPDGVVVFTTYGRYVAHLLRTGENLLNLTEEQAKEVLRDYDATGFGFHATPTDGDCVASRPWVCARLDEIPGLNLVIYLEASWMGQDVIACTRSFGPAFRDDDSVIQRAAHAERFARLVSEAVPAEATVLVVSRGEGELVQLDGDREGWHFPRAGDGSWLGYYPSDDSEAIVQLEELRAEGATYLALPDEALWWLDHYRGFARHLEEHYRLLRRDERGAVYVLDSPTR
jgi:SAM-dependent methyltransferase